MAMCNHSHDLHCVDPIRFMLPYTIATAEDEMTSFIALAVARGFGLNLRGLYKFKVAFALWCLLRICKDKK